MRRRRAPMVGERAERTTRTRVRMPLPAMVLVVVILASMAASTAWRLAGNSLYFIATPSMCPSLCVGSLAIDTPASGRTLHVGDTITFHPPGVSQVYTHRIVKFAEGGQAIFTEGVASSRPDPWTITPVDVEGVVVASVWGVGWFFRALPFMSVGVVILLLFRRYVSVRDRRDTDRLISILLLAIPLAIMKPLLGAYTVSIASTKRAGIDVVRVINTGLLPARIHAIGGQTREHVAPGQMVSVRGPVVSGSGVPFRETASLYWSGWLIAAALVLVPAVSFAFDVARRHYSDTATLEESSLEGEPDETTVAAPIVRESIDGERGERRDTEPAVAVATLVLAEAKVAVPGVAATPPHDELIGASSQVRVKGGLAGW